MVVTDESTKERKAMAMTINNRTARQCKCRADHRGSHELVTFSGSCHHSTRIDWLLQFGGNALACLPDWKTQCQELRRMTGRGVAGLTAGLDTLTLTKIRSAFGAPIRLICSSLNIVALLVAAL